MSTRVLVTGCAGYLGSVLCPLLVREGYEVHGVDDFLYGNHFALFPLLGEKSFSFTHADVRDIARYANRIHWADAVIPLAAIVGAPACEKNPQFAHSINTQAIHDLCLHLSPEQRLIYPNTNSGYGQTDGQREVKEEDDLSPISVYGQTKVEGEKRVLQHRQGISLRLATVFGVSPRMRLDLLVNDFVHRLQTYPFPLQVFQPEYRRNFVHVRDVCRVMIRMIADHRLLGVYNVGHPQANLSKIDLARMVARELGFDPDKRVQIGQGQDPDQRNYLVSNAKLLSTGFRFDHDLASGIREVGQMVGWLIFCDISRMRNV